MRKRHQDPRLTVKTSWKAKRKAETKRLRQCWIASGGDPEVFRTGIKGPLPDSTRTATSQGRIPPEPAPQISDEERHIRQLSLQAYNLAELLDAIETGLEEMRPKSPEQWPALENEAWDGHKRSMESIDEFLKGTT